MTRQGLFCPFSPLLGTLKLSQMSPDVPNSEGGAHPHKDLPNAHSQQQVASRSVSSIKSSLDVCVLS